MTVKVKVTREDIKNGRPGKAYDCALALAISNAVHVEDVGVDGRRAIIGLMRPAIPLPTEAVQWVDDYDEGLPVEPFTFDLELPSVETRPAPAAVGG